MTRDSTPRTTPAWLPWLLALAGFALDLAAYWPGQMSYDSAYAWWQARGGETTGIVPPAFVLVWRLCDQFLSGPGLLFALHLTLFWSGLALLVRALRMRTFATLAMFLIALTPVPWLLRGHVWTDVGLFSALTFVAGAFACAHAEGARRWLWLALPALLYAAVLRLNALPAALPFVAWFAVLARSGNFGRPARRWSDVALPGGGLLAAIVAVNLSLASTVQRPVPIWPMIAQFDLVAMSIKTDRMLLPESAFEPGLDVAELRQAFRVWSLLEVLGKTRHRIHPPFEEHSEEEFSSLRSAWVDAILEHPRAWASHRWRFTRGLFGTYPAYWPSELVYVDLEASYKDNPAVEPNRSSLHRALLDTAAALRATPLLAPWPYLLLGLLAVPAAWRRRRSVPGVVALALLASAWMYAVPLALTAVSIELRYLGWPCLASALAAACAWLAPRPKTPLA